MVEPAAALAVGSICVYADLPGYSGFSRNGTIDDDAERRGLSALPEGLQFDAAGMFCSFSRCNAGLQCVWIEHGLQVCAVAASLNNTLANVVSNGLEDDGRILFIVVCLLVVVELILFCVFVRIGHSKTAWESRGVAPDPQQNALLAVACSGGGVRSALFCGGVVDGMGVAKGNANGLSVRCVSSVSGGGYFASRWFAGFDVDRATLVACAANAKVQALEILFLLLGVPLLIVHWLVLRVGAPVFVVARVSSFMLYNGPSWACALVAGAIAVAIQITAWLGHKIAGCRKDERPHVFHVWRVLDAAAGVIWLVASSLLVVFVLDLLTPGAHELAAKAVSVVGVVGLLVVRVVTQAVVGHAQRRFAVSLSLFSLPAGALTGWLHYPDDVLPLPFACSDRAYDMNSVCFANGSTFWWLFLSVGVAFIFTDALTLSVTDTLVFRIYRWALKKSYLGEQVANTNVTPHVPLWIGAMVVSGWRQFVSGRPFKLLEVDHTWENKNEKATMKVVSAAHLSSMHYTDEVHRRLAQYSEQRVPFESAQVSASARARGTIELKESAPSAAERASKDAESVTSAHKIDMDSDVLPGNALESSASGMWSLKVESEKWTLTPPLITQRQWTLVDTVALSGAAVAGNMGRYAADRTLRNLSGALLHVGLNMGAFVSFKKTKEPPRVDRLRIVVWLICFSVIGAIFVATGVTGLLADDVDDSLLDATRPLETSSLALALLPVAVAIAAFCFQWRLSGATALRNLLRSLDFDRVGSENVTQLFASDGGHLENLALWPLVRRWYLARTRGDKAMCWSGSLQPQVWAVSIDGSQDTEVLTMRGDDICFVVNTCRAMLPEVQVRAFDGGDFDAEYAKFRGEGKNRLEPFIFKFQVVYEKVIHEMVVIYVKPMLAKPAPAVHGCCCSGCSGCFCLKYCGCGSFPNDSTGNQFYHEKKADAYFELGQQHGLIVRGLIQRKLDLADGLHRETSVRPSREKL